MEKQFFILNLFIFNLKLHTFCNHQKDINIKSLQKIQGGAHKSGLFQIFKQMNIKSSILKILLNFKNWEAE